jgi:multidrug resistance efflux pump
VKLSHPGALAKADIDKMQASLDAMNANVAKITEAGEKERWQANCDMWRLVLSEPTISSANLATIKTRLATMKANVAKISERAEKGRWQADRDLWQSVIGKT